MAWDEKEFRAALLREPGRCYCEICERPIERPALNAYDFAVDRRAPGKYLCPTCIAAVVACASGKQNLLCSRCGELGAFTRMNGSKLCDPCAADEPSPE
jgi:hypothetical protein